MRSGVMLLAGLVLLAGCGGGGVPTFLGREGGTGFYRVGGEPAPVPVAVPMREATAERALHGVIVRVEGEAPTQGYWGAALLPLGTGDADAAGIVSFRFVATPPAGAEAVGPARTRQLSAGIFIPNLALRTTRAVRVAGIGTAETLPLPAAPPRPQVAAPDL